VTRSTDEGDGRAGEDPRDPGPGYSVTDKRRFAQDGGAGGSEEPSSAAPTEEEEPDEVGDDLAAARSQAAEYLAHLQRLQAEFDNYRKRVLKEQTRSVEQAAQPVMRRLLEVLDDFELALIHATEKPDYDKFLHGIELVYAKLIDSLKSEGLERIAAEGTPFDPERHEALMQTGEGDGEPVVADVLRPGYTLKGRVLRPAGVRVERK
jgi:molecular chaperone GrpE